MDIQKLFSVEGKVVCVTGGGSGIGRTIADGFVSGGARVYIASRRDLAGAARELSEQGPGECIGLQADLSREEDIVGLARTLKEREGKLDVLVNNSGLGVVSHRFEEFPLDDFDRLQAVNVAGAVRDDAGVPAAAGGGRQIRRARLRHQHRLHRRPSASRRTTTGPTVSRRPPCTT